jgi:transposase
MPITRIYLLPEEREELSRIEKRDLNWRIRERALTVLLLAEGMTCSEVSEQVGIHSRTVGVTRKGWLEEKFESLPDKARTGAPKKLTLEERMRILEWARAEPMTSQQLLARHLSLDGTPVHFNTIVNVLRDKDMVWKRTRHSLKKTG